MLIDILKFMAPFVTLKLYFSYYAHYTFPSFIHSLDLRPKNYEEVKKHMDGFNSGAIETAARVLNR